MKKNKTLKKNNSSRKKEKKDGQVDSNKKTLITIFLKNKQKTPKNSRVLVIFKQPKNNI